LRLQFKQKFERAQIVWQDLGLCLAMLLTSWSIFFKVWTYTNDYMPACLSLAILAGWGFGQVSNRTRQSNRDIKTSWLHAGVLLLLLLQFVVLLYNPLQQLPTGSDRAAAEKFVARVRALPGEVWVFSHGFYSYLAGKTTYFHSAPLGDVLGGNTPPQDSDTFRRWAIIAALYQQAVIEQHFNWIIVDKLPISWAPYYVSVEELPDNQHVFYPVTGAPSRPEFLLARNPVAKGGQLPVDDPTFNALFVAGWNLPEDGKRWTFGNRSVIQIPLEEGHSYQISGQIQPFCSEQHPTIQTVKIGWNDQLLGEITFPSCDEQVTSFNLPAENIIKGVNELWFEHTEKLDNPGAPGIGLSSLTFVQR
jgi:hypothetical protein